MRKIMTVMMVAGLVLCLMGTVWAQREFYGTVQKLPQKGFIGQWLIDGKPVQVVKETKLDFEHGPAQIGSYVEVKGLTFQGKYVAWEIETKRKR